MVDLRFEHVTTHVALTSFVKVFFCGGEGISSPSPSLACKPLSQGKKSIKFYFGHSLWPPKIAFVGTQTRAQCAEQHRAFLISIDFLYI